MACIVVRCKILVGFMTEEGGEAPRGRDGNGVPISKDFPFQRRSMEEAITILGAIVGGSTACWWFDPGREQGTLVYVFCIVFTRCLIVGDPGVDLPRKLI